MCNETEKLQSLKLPYLGQHCWGSFSPIIAEFPPSRLPSSRSSCSFRCFQRLIRRVQKIRNPNPWCPFRGCGQASVSHISTLEKKYIVESMSGAGLIDCDYEGKLDIITVNGSTITATAQWAWTGATISTRARLSLLVTNFTEQPAPCIATWDRKDFPTSSWPAKLAHPTFPMVKWGTAFFDIDNDGWLDIFVAHGHVYPRARRRCRRDSISS